MNDNKAQTYEEWINWFYYYYCPNFQHKAPIPIFELILEGNTKICNPYVQPNIKPWRKSGHKS